MSMIDVFCRESKLSQTQDDQEAHTHAQDTTSHATAESNEYEETKETFDIDDSQNLNLLWEEHSASEMSLDCDLEK